mmetsp:Transcript_15986/g.49938  ORF Transcript_15986/g.49938 Transcript_15986/m.49938 type:complete len:177 (+) Transcript_15986:88-618(+)
MEDLGKEVKNVAGAVRDFRAGQSEEQRNKGANQQGMPLFQSHAQVQRGITTDQSLDELEAGAAKFKDGVYVSKTVGGRAGSAGAAGSTSGAAAGAPGGFSSSGGAAGAAGFGSSSGGGRTAGGVTTTTTRVAGTPSKHDGTVAAKFNTTNTAGGDLWAQMAAGEKAKFAPPKHRLQ